VAMGINWLRDRFDHAIRTRQWAQAFIWGALLIVVIITANLFRDRLESWANNKIDTDGEAFLTSFITSIWFPTILFVLVLAIGIVTFHALWQRSSKPESIGSRHTRNVASEPNLELLLWVDVQFVHFGWLWSDDPYLLFGVGVFNKSPYLMEFNRVTGSGNINATPCTRPTVMAQSITVQGYARPHGSGSFYQPITEAMGRTLQTMLAAHQRISFDMSGIELHGTATMPDGPKPIFVRVGSGQPFLVDGSRISQEHSQASPAPLIFVGSGPEPH